MNKSEYKKVGVLPIWKGKKSLMFRALAFLSEDGPTLEMLDFVFLISAVRKPSFSFLIGQHTPVNSQCPAVVASFPSSTVNYWTEVSKKLQNNKILQD